MAKIWITGSTDGLGKLTAIRLIEMGHQVVLHARNVQRAENVRSSIQGAENVLIADLSDRQETIKLADKVNTLGTFDAIIHNAGVYQASSQDIFSVNTLAPYILTCLVHKPKRLIYLSSGLHLHGDPALTGLESGRVSYSDSKLHDVILAKVVARKWPDVYSNAVNPGWVPTKMGGAGAPDNLQKGYETQVWLAVSNDINVTGGYFFHRKETRYLQAADQIHLQDRFLERCSQITGIPFPE